MRNNLLLGRLIMCSLFESFNTETRITTGMPFFQVQLMSNRQRTMKTSVLLLVLIAVVLFSLVINWQYVGDQLIMVGQYIGYRFLTSANAIKIRLNNLRGQSALVDTSWDGQSAWVLQALQDRYPTLTIRNLGATTSIPTQPINGSNLPALYIVDIGAHDGIWLSNSHYFIQAGFSGLLIEPHPQTFKKLKRTWTKYRII